MTAKRAPFKERSQSSREPSHGTHPNANGKIILKSTWLKGDILVFQEVRLPVGNLFREKSCCGVMETTFTLIFHTNRLCRRHHIIIFFFFILIIIIVLPISRSWESLTQHVFFGSSGKQIKLEGHKKSTKKK